MREEISRLRDYVAKKIAPTHDLLNLKMLKGADRKSPTGYADSHAVQTRTQHQATRTRHQAVTAKVVQATEILKQYLAETSYRYGNVGCGHEATINLNEHLTDTFPGHTFHWVGLDVSQKTIEIAVNMLEENKREAEEKASRINIQFKVFDIFNLLDEFDPQQIPLYPWHLAVIAGVLHNYNDSECALFLKATKRCLQKNGLLVLGEAAYESYSSFKRFILTKFVIPIQMYQSYRVGFGVKFHYRKYEGFRAIISNAGLEIIEYELVNPNHIFLLRNK